LPPATVQRIRNKKRHKIIIDDIKEIDSNTMKTQLSDTRAILGSLELAPPTRKLMLWKETGGVDRLLTMTCRPVYSKAISKVRN
jgi:cohesin complex subunit SCC1